MTQTVKLYNRGKRTVLGVHKDTGDDFRFAPETAMEFSKEDAANIRRLYPTEVVDMDGVTREFEQKAKASEDAAILISKSEAEKAKKQAVEEAVQQAVADALAKNNEIHEAARIAMEQKSKEDLDVALALAEEKSPESSASAEEDKFATMNTVDKIVSGKKKP